jgi:hypothetical protein
MPVAGSRETYEPVARDLAAQYGVDPDFVSRLITQESNWDPAADSGKAGGIMQFTPSTAKAYGLTSEERYKPEKAIPAGVRHIADLFKKYGGDQEKVASAYNAGEPATDSGRAAGFPETQDYVAKVASPTPPDLTAAWDKASPDLSGAWDAAAPDLSAAWEQAAPIDGEKTPLQRFLGPANTLVRRLNEAGEGLIGGAANLVSGMRYADPITGLPANFSGRHILEAILHPGTDNPTTDAIANSLAVVAAPYGPELAVGGAVVEEAAKTVGVSEEKARAAGDIGSMLFPFVGHAAPQIAARVTEVQTRIEAAQKVMSEAMKMLKDTSLTEAVGKGLGEGLATRELSGPSTEPAAMAARVQPGTPEALVEGLRKIRWQEKQLASGPLDLPPPRPVAAPEAKPAGLVTAEGAGIYRADLDAELSGIITRARARGLNIPETPDRIIKPLEIKPKEGPKKIREGQTIILADETLREAPQTTTLATGLPQEPQYAVPEGEVQPPPRLTLPEQRAIDVAMPSEAARQARYAEIAQKRRGPPPENVLAGRERFGTPEQQAGQDAARHRAAMEAVRLGDAETARLNARARVREAAEAAKKGEIPAPIPPPEPEMLDASGPPRPAAKLVDGTLLVGNGGHVSLMDAIERATSPVAESGWSYRGKFFTDAEMESYFAGKPGELSASQAGQRPIVARASEPKPETIVDLIQQMQEAAQEGPPIPGLSIVQPSGPPAAPLGARIERNFSQKGALYDKMPGRGGLNQLEEADPELAGYARAAATSKELADETVKVSMLAVDQIGRKAFIKNAVEKYKLVRLESALRDQGKGNVELAKTIRSLSDPDLADVYGNSPWGPRAYLKAIDETAAMAGRNLLEKADRAYTNGNWDRLRGLLSTAFDEAAAKIGKTNLSEAEFQSIKSSEWFKKAHGIVTKTLTEPLEEAHFKNKGVPLQFPSELGYWPLISKSEPGLARKTKGGIPLPPGNVIRTALAPEYDISTSGMYKTVRRAFTANNLGIMMRAMEDKGLLRVGRLHEGQTFDWSGRTFVAARLEKYQSAIVPKWLADEINPIVSPPESQWMELTWNSERQQWKMRANGFSKYAAWTTQGAIFGPAEGIGHTFNIVGASISKMPVVGSGPLGRALSLGLKAPSILMNVLREPVSPLEIQATARDMIRNGEMHPRWLSVTWSKRFAEVTGARRTFSLAPMLYGRHGLDIKARVYARRLAMKLEPGMSANELYHYSMNFGQYNKALVDRTTARLKGPLTPFFTASSTAAMNAIHTITGGGTLPGGAGLRVYNAINSGALGITAAWIIAYKAYVGKSPWEDKGRSRLFQIPLNPDDRAADWAVQIWGPPSTGTAYLNFGRLFSPLAERAGRTTGLRGLIETKAHGGNWGQAGEAALKDVVNTILGMTLGQPPFRVAFNLLGAEPAVQSFRDDRGHFAPTIMRTVKERVEPGLPTVIAVGKKALGGFLPLGGRLEEAREKKRPLRGITDTMLPNIFTGPVKTGIATRILRRQLAESKKKK